MSCIRIRLYTLAMPSQYRLQFPKTDEVITDYIWVLLIMHVVWLLLHTFSWNIKTDL